MKHTRGYIRLLVLFAFLALCGAGEASAQVPLDRYRSAKTFVRSGLMPKPDSLAKNHLTDSLLLMRVDSLLQDSTLRDSLLRSGIDSLRLRDSLAARLHPQFVPDSALLLKTDSLPAALGAPDSLAGRKDLRPRRDTISLSGVSWISLVAPGFGQIYNKQYWKLPILYGTVGAGLTLFFHENNTYKPLKRQYNALLENVVVRADGTIDFDDGSKTENTRVSYPIDHIDNIVKPVSKAGHATKVIFLTADAFGVLPPVSRLTADQTQYHFLSGFTAKLAGTERGVTEPTPTFSACFGAAFLSLHPTQYAEVLVKRMQAAGAQAYLVNTGWNGTGKRISIKDTRAIIDAILNGSLDNAETFTLPMFNLQIPTALPGVDPQILDPRSTYGSPEQWQEKADQLAKLFIENFEKYTDTPAGAALVAAGPQR